ncbi:uncharacterized protein LOC131840702 [Achroia grisella]|uniref:uncharacterized protein LOC131840702 n=1 Tax=Achroia grisella TaxID=688607 RepID=UPI0027D2FBF2|nr:uncharacterized protein LOC131840702 [Achroia grisella]
MLVALYIAACVVNIIGRTHNYNIYIPKNEDMDIRVRRSATNNIGNTNEHDTETNEVRQMNDNEVLKEKMYKYILDFMNNYNQHNAVHSNEVHNDKLTHIEVDSDESLVNDIEIHYNENLKQIEVDSDEADPVEVANDHIIRTKRYLESNGQTNKRNRDSAPGLTIMNACFLCVSFGCAKNYRRVGNRCIPTDNDY